MMHSAPAVFGAAGKRIIVYDRALCSSSAYGNGHHRIGISFNSSKKAWIRAAGACRNRRRFLHRPWTDGYSKRNLLRTSPIPSGDDLIVSPPSLCVVDEEEVPIVVTPDIDDGDDKPLKLLQSGNSAVLSACVVGLFTGLAVVFFNYAVHELRDLCWGGIPDLGASWLREESIESKWVYVVLVPAFGGLLVSLLNMTRTAIEDSTDAAVTSIKSSMKPILKTVAACVTLGTGNSLGPEGPSVEIGVFVAKAVGTFLDKGAQRKLSLRAAGSAAGISSGFNAAVAGCFFAVESVLWPSQTETSLSLTNATSMVILSAVIASVISEIGLGSEPAFAVPFYDFRSPSELPLYLLLGILCGLVSLSFSKLTSFMLVFVDAIQRTAGVPKAVFPIFGGLTVGFIALAYPEILYWGFQNVDTLLESCPSSNSLSADLLLQLVAAKIVATALCRASGLVGGYYAPSLFIGAATGMAYGKLVSRLASISDPIFHISIFEVASPQAYGLVGMAATLAGVCQVPLTAVLLLFELTQDYRIVLPLLGAVGLSSLITSDKTRNTNRTSIENTRKLKVGSFLVTSPEKSAYGFNVNSTSPENSICELESSLCMSDGSDDDADLASEIPVSQAMRTRYVTTRMETCLMDTVSLLLEEKQSYAMIIDDDNRLIGQLTIVEIQQFVQLTMTRRRKPQLDQQWMTRIKIRDVRQVVRHIVSLTRKFSPNAIEVLRVSDLYCSFDKNCGLSWAVNPNTSLLTALRMMNIHGLSRLPVVLDDGDGHLVGVLDRESIDLASRAFAIREAGSRYENSKD